MTVVEIADRVRNLDLGRPVRVAVDGRTASGKTNFADRLANRIEGIGRRVIRASVDGFHRPAVDRYRRGRLSPEGYYQDARDYLSMREILLDPLGPNGDRFYATEIFDLERDRPIEPAFEQAETDSILIVDGTFLQRPEFRGAWDFVIFLDVPALEARRRGVERDSSKMEGAEAAARLYDKRYAPAFELYDAECRPAEQAQVVITP